MNKLTKLLITSITSVSLLACNDTPTSAPKNQEEIYNFRDEKYQDFYSKFMREVEKRDKGSITPNDNFERPFDKKFIQNNLGIEHNDDILFKLVIDRVKPEENKTCNQNNHFNDKNDVLNLYNKNELDDKGLKKYLIIEYVMIIYK